MDGGAKRMQFYRRPLAIQSSVQQHRASSGDAYNRRASKQPRIARGLAYRHAALAKEGSSSKR